MAVSKRATAVFSGEEPSDLEYVLPNALQWRSVALQHKFVICRVQKGIEQQLLLCRPPAIDGSRTHASLTGDVNCGYPGDGKPAQETVGRVQDRGTRGFTAWPAGGTRGFGFRLDIQFAHGSPPSSV
jgi:hypothetical protein